MLPEDVTFSFAEARELVLDTYDSFSPEAGRIARRFFDEHWVDAPVRPHKRGGAFCAYTVPTVHPYVLLNFTARRRDVLTMAHELGHGLHAALAQPQGVFHQSTPLTLAETASVFGEALVFGRMLDAAEDDDARLGLLAERIDGAIATVFRQMAMNRFEHLVHTRRRAEGELSVDRICELWVETQAELFGDSVEITDGYRMWWSYVPHFINTPGLRLRVRLRPAARAVGLRPLPRGGRPVRPALPRAARRPAARAAPRSSARSSGSTSPTPGFWDAGPGAGRAAAARGRGASRDARAGQAPSARVLPLRVRERSSWRSTTLTISFITCSIPVALASPCANASRQSRTWPLVASSLKCERGIESVHLRVGGDVLGHLRAGQLDAVHLHVATAAQLEPGDELQRLQRRHLVEEPLDGGLDQRLGVRWRGQTSVYALDGYPERKRRRGFRVQRHTTGRASAP